MGFTLLAGVCYEKRVWLDVMKPHEKCSIFCFLRELSLAAWVPASPCPATLGETSVPTALIQHTGSNLP